MAESPSSTIPRRFFGIKRQFLLLLAGVYVLTGAVALALFGWGIHGVTRQLGEEFAAQYALRQKDRILAPIQHELTLARKLVDSPLLKRWARDENNPDLKTAALAELESYRRHFADRSYFMAIDASRHFYFNDSANAYQGRELGHTLDPALPSDSWYFATIAQPSDFSLNVNYDAPLDLNKLWFNIVIRDGADILGVGGTGLELDGFIKAALQEDRQGVQTLLLDRAGAIKAHHERAYIDFNTVAKPESERSTFYRLLATLAEQDVVRAQLERLSTGQLPVAVTPLTVEGKPHLAAIAYLQEIQWFAVALVDIADIYRFGRFAPFAALLALSLLALALSVTVLLNRLVLNPLARLHRSTQAIAVGDYGQLAEVAANNEIGALTDAFNDMAHTVRQYTDHLEQRVAERTQALDQANQQLAEAHRQVLDSIQYAQLLQQAILPQPELMARALGEHFVIWQPRNLVGGDFYYCQADHRGCLLMVADCTGHGVPGALMTMTVNSVLNHVLSTLGAAAPALILQAINRLLRTTLRQDQMGEGFEAGLDTGACYWSESTSLLTFAGARLDLYYRDSDGTVAVVHGDRRNLGYRQSDPDWTFTSHSIARLPGRTFYLITDGLLDQSGGSKGYGFGRKQFLMFLQQYGELPLIAQQTALEHTLADWRGEQLQRDDMTVIGFRPALEPPASP